MFLIVQANMRSNARINIGIAVCWNEHRSYTITRIRPLDYYSAGLNQWIDPVYHKRPNDDERNKITVIYFYKCCDL